MKIFKTKVLYILCVLFVCSSSLSSFTHYANIESMTVKNGLNNNTVYSLLHSKNGFIWLSTDMGISRYDGFHFRNFPFVNAEVPEASLPEAVFSMHEVEDGLMLLQLSDGRVACFDCEKECYLPVEFKKPYDGGKVTGVYVADKNLIYLATEVGLYYARIERSRKPDEQNVEIACSVEPLIKGNLSHLCGDESGNLFFCINGNRVAHYLMGVRKVEQVDKMSDKAEITSLSVQEGCLWICRKWEDVCCYDFRRKTYQNFPDLGSPNRTSLKDTYITDVVAVDKSTLYFATWSGLYCLRLTGDRLNDAAYSITNLTGVNETPLLRVEKKMQGLLWDASQNILWGGTFGGGVLKVGFNEDAYNRINQQIGTSITGIAEDSKGYIWLVANRKGIWRSKENSLSSTTTFAPWSKGAEISGTYLIYKDMNGCFWLGNENLGIVYIDPVSEEIRQYRIPNAEKLGVIKVRRFCLDSRGRLWVATDRGLFLFNCTDEKFRHLNLGKEAKEVYAVDEDKEGTIWLGTDMGVKWVDLQADKINLKGSYEKDAGLKPGRVLSLYVNTYNQILASYGDKIIRIDGRNKEKVEKLFTLADGLNSGHIFCMVDDQNGNTWVGGNSGIMTIRNDRASFYNYSVTGCCEQVCRLRDGRLLWTDSWGLIFFDPMIVKNRKVQKNLVLSDVWVNGNSVAVNEKVNGQEILFTAPHCQDKFVFTANNNDFSFYFSDMQYSMMQRKIAYRLLPNEEWYDGSPEDGIHYSNLSSGNYTLQVKLIYPDASEGTVLEVPVVVKQFWWRSGWAILLYVLFAGAVLAGIYYYMIQKGKKKMVYREREASFHEELGIAKTQQVEKQEAYEMRNLVFTRFIQELRMPLSMIISPLKEVMQEKELSKGLSTKVLMAYRNSIGMLNAYDQLLAIYNQNPDDQKMEVAPYSLVKFLDGIVLSINELLCVHPIEFQYEKKVKKDLEVWMDKKKMEFVVQNLLSNAFFHVRHAGAVVLMVQEIVEEENTYFTVTVVDNGKGVVKVIEQEKIDDLALIDSAEVELGYGAMENVANLHHGSIVLEHVKSGGTKVQIKCPVAKRVFESDANVTFINPEELKEVKLPDASVKKMITEEDMADVVEVTSTTLARDRKTLLIIEDYKDIRFYLKTLFEKEYNVLLAVNGVEGTTMARKELPDLIISDVMMPLKDGFECCKEIKEGLDTCHIPVILLTAKVEDDDIVKGLECGADAYILKPFTPKILKAKVRNLIEGRANLKQMYNNLLVAPPADNDAQSGVPEKSVEIEDPFISTVVKIIEENIQEPDFNVKKLASDLNMSQPTLYRKVKQFTDFTIIELIRGVRLRKAAVLLKKRTYSVQEVAEMVGYNDIPTFRKHFVDTYGATPSAYASQEEVHTQAPT